MGEVCFICRTPYSSSSADTADNSFKGGDKIEDQLTVVFILRKLLELPLSVCVDLLQENGNPSGWLRCCIECTFIIANARKTYNKLLSLQKRFDVHKSQLKAYIEIANQGCNLDTNNYLSNKAKHLIPEYILNLYLSQKYYGTAETCTDYIKDEVMDYAEENEELDWNFMGGNETSDYASLEDGGDAEDDTIPPEGNIHSHFGTEKDGTEGIENENCVAEEVHVQDREPHSDDGKIEELLFGDEDSNFRCEYCGRGFRYKSTCDFHTRRQHTKETTDSCEKCGERFIGRKAVLRHFAKAHPEDKPTLLRSGRNNLSRGKTIIVCDICGRNCNGPAQYKTHMRCHTKEKPYMCELCPHRAFSITVLNWHRKSKHYEELDLEPFKCNECGKIVTNQKILQHHIASYHTKKFENICDICGAGYADKYRMLAHIKLKHENQKLFECKECGEKLSWRRQISEHRQKHSGIYDHVCSICQKGFTCGSFLRRHMKYHSAAFASKRKSRLKAIEATTEQS